jgi:hypothetical protein
MACGTPVIAFRRGSVPEVMADGVTGLVVEDLEQAVAAVGRIGEIDRAACRAWFEEHFSAERMARGYTDLYGTLIASRAEAVYDLPRAVRAHASHPEDRPSRQLPAYIHPAAGEEHPE